MSSAHELPAQISAQLHAIEGHVDGHVRWILDTASACPPGGNATWDRVLAHYGASADPALKRLTDAQTAQQSRGATLVEVRRALDAMLAQAKTELERTLGQGAHDPSAEYRITTLRAKLTRVTDETLARYAQDVCPPKAAVAASVNSVFANAQATAKHTPWASYVINPQKVLTCHACGAPQEVALDFVCRYCKSNMLKQ